MLDNGCIVERGSHEELRQKDGGCYNEFVKTYNEIKETLHETVETLELKQSLENQSNKAKPRIKRTEQTASRSSSNKATSTEKQSLLNQKQTDPSDKIIVKEKIQTGNVKLFLKKNVWYSC
jgi:ABC-type multidrug transport system ATPase subunit